ncbi:hypothetical protein NZD89_22465 [Alicyclobacillus fastidiosus]|uniref:Methyl-accepting chemotaxis protein n=1 Tax=Alicyclobacillus fastidiosus TaxID=392011 RepID=A0ABY6ZDV7_9BACL|nr:hypothetical protein [Alicyclobacillus fastidiosus]WAH41022.1 hypothetical protein NZD89_22465 [Alicyclobacillus fastidiosus]GMA62544.1 hypothetical protein GCM10025859_29840 [Alicyclobacillus fastidiosus]
MRAKRILTLVSTCLSLAGLGVFGYSMTQQTQIQSQMNHTMATMNADIAETTPLVRATSRALSPLTQTTAALSQIELEESQTVRDISAMNAHLQAIGTSEGQVLMGMNALYHATSDVNKALGGVTSTTDGILDASESSASSAGAETSRIGTLNQQTADVISQLNQLNNKLAALKLLP